MGRRATPLLLAGALALGACGGGSNSDTAVSATDTGGAAATTPATEAIPPDTVDAPQTTPATQPRATAAATESPSTASPATETVENTEPAPAEAAPPGTEPAAVETEPAPVEPEVGGRTLATEVQAASQFDANPFPDLVVDDVGRAGSANLANIVPADRPVLLWAWAPH